MCKLAFCRSHLPVALSNFLLLPFFGIDMEVLDAELEPLKNRITLSLLWQQLLLLRASASALASAIVVVIIVTAVTLQ
jgi:hypothetical protein